MPSFLDLLQPSDGDDPSSSAADGAVPLGVLATVRAEGGRRRRRRQRRNLVFAGVAAVAVAVPAFALVGGGGDAPEDVRSAELADATTTTADDDRPATTATSDPTEVAGVVIERTPEEAAAAATTTTTARPRPTTTSTVPPTAPPLVCVDSVDPACGAFSWNPTPSDNAALALTADPVPDVPAGGSQAVTVHWADADATLTYVDDDGDGTLIGTACASDARFGPWSPPAPVPGAGAFTVQFAAPSAPGSYVLTVLASTRNGECEYDPYGSETSLAIPITVVAPG